MADKPKPPKATSIIVPHVSGTQLNPGDIVTSSTDDGWHVVLKPHVAMKRPTAFQSDDTYHWSVGQS